jgi:hypothetical protein
LPVLRPPNHCLRKTQPLKLLQTHNFNILRYGTGTHDDVLLMRTRLNAGCHFTEKARAFVEFQGARYWLSSLTVSDFGRSTSYYDEFDLRQAHLEWLHIGNTPLGVKLGRQIMLYGARRLLRGQA